MIACLKLIAIGCFFSRSANYKCTHLALMDYYFTTRNTDTDTQHTLIHTTHNTHGICMAFKLPNGLYLYEM